MRCGYAFPHPLNARIKLTKQLARAQVVNALLTQLDKLKTRKNCLVMTTSNLTGAIGASTLLRPVRIVRRAGAH